MISNLEQGVWEAEDLGSALAQVTHSGLFKSSFEHSDNKVNLKNRMWVKLFPGKPTPTCALVVQVLPVQPMGF